MVVKGGAVIAFDEQGRPVLTKEIFQVGCDLEAVLLLRDEGPELEA